MPRCTRSLPLLAILLAVSCSTSRTELATAERPAIGDSPGPWLQYRDVQQAGFDEQALLAVCERADSLRSGALMAVFRGRVILACGDVERPFEAHSIRKSLVSGLYGVAVARGEIDLDATLAAVAIDDQTPLTAAERSATIRQVISARSGIYLPAAYAPTSQDRRPGRGTYSPGTHWFYNNWDFNVAGVIYERATGEDLYESFNRRLAKPLGMEDWDQTDGFRVYEPTKSRHPAHTFRISARDLARFGQLYLQDGRWEGQQLLPPDWIRESTRPHTDDGDGTGYGYMWWTYQAGSTFTAKYPTLNRYTFYRGWGTGEQGLWVIPGADLVVVHRADTDHARTVGNEDHWKLVESVVAARQREPQLEPELRTLQPTALPSQLPPAAIPTYRALSSSVLDDYLGEYKLAPGPAQLAGRTLTPGGTVRVFLFDGKPYLHLPGAGDVMMFPTGTDTFTIRAVPGVGVAFERGARDNVTTVTVTVTFSGRSFKASRAQAE
jgi:CubicO group peptidase (beta-lactamase class C family)